jgi:hypothetical protein
MWDAFPRVAIDALAETATIFLTAVWLING